MKDEDDDLDGPDGAVSLSKPKKPDNKLPEPIRQFLIEVAESTLEAAKEWTDKYGEVPPTTVTYVGRGGTHDTEVIDFQDDDEKRRMFHKVARKAAKQGDFAVMVLQDTYYLVVDDRDKSITLENSPRPSKSPNRREAFQAIVVMADGEVAVMRRLCYRREKQSCLGEPDRIIWEDDPVPDVACEGIVEQQLIPKWGEYTVFPVKEGSAIDITGMDKGKSN